MAVAAPSGAISHAEQRLGDMLSMCDEFQALTGTATSTAASNHIYYHALPPPANGMSSYAEGEQEQYRPLALVYTGEMEGYRLRKIGTNTVQGSGFIHLHLEADVPDTMTGDEAAIQRWFNNILGRIIQKPSSEPATFKGLIELVADGHLPISEIELVSVVRSTEIKKVAQGDFILALLDIRWGVF